MDNDFFDKPTTQLAQDLIGCELIHETDEGTAAGRIVETEAYLHDDPAAHTYNGQTPRNKAMFGKPGHAYIYVSYGIHHCMNVSANKPGVGEGILIRALEPTRGKDLMKRRRATDQETNLCSGPGKLTQALGITKQQYGQDLSDPASPLRLREGQAGEIETDTRIGISKAQDKKLRYHEKNNPHVSR